nr:reverse transcriptase domain-containing protein [Tanacetum cinerariifolium]
MSDAAIKKLIAQGVVDVLADYKANKSSRNGHDSHNSRSGGERTPQTACLCTYKDFLNCELINFKGTKSNVMSARSKTMQEAIEVANDLMDQKVHTYAEKEAKNKRTLDNNSSNNNTPQPPFKKQNVARAYAVRPNEKKEYAGTLPLYKKCKFHHNDPCTVKCANCKRVGHLTRNCRNLVFTNNQRTLTYYECGNQGHYRSDCPKLKNQNCGNQSENDEACGMVYASGGGETNQDLNNIEDDVDA